MLNVEYWIVNVFFEWQDDGSNRININDLPRGDIGQVWFKSVSKRASELMSK